MKRKIKVNIEVILHTELSDAQVEGGIKKGVYYGLDVTKVASPKEIEEIKTVVETIPLQEVTQVCMKRDWNNVKIVPNNYDSLPKKKFLIALPAYPGRKGFNHQAILVTAINKKEAIDTARALRPRKNIGDIKEVNC